MTEPAEKPRPIPQYLSPQTWHRVCEFMRSLANEGNFKVSFKPVSQRTIEQNDKIHAVCTDISRQVGLTDKGWRLYCDWLDDKNHYRFFSHEDWKHILMAGFTKAEVVPGLEHGQMVCLYPSTTNLSLSRGSDFIEYCIAYGNDMGVEWSDEPDKTRGAMGGMSDVYDQVARDYQPRDTERD